MNTMKLKATLLVGIFLLYDLRIVHMQCLKSYHSCGDNGLLKCIPQEWLCDHNRDCEDGSDEAKCPSVKCGEDQFRCMNSDRCISKSQQCDGSKDCEDGSDEETCERKVCNKLIEYDCENTLKTECIPLKNVCDGALNCSNNRNLKEDCNTDMCKGLNKKQQCSYKCINRYSSFVCDCSEGMKLLNDDITCEKIDVCLETPGICEQECTSTMEGHSCSCYKGYTKVNQHCVLNDSNAAAHLLYLSFDGISAATLFEGAANKKLLTTAGKLVSFDVKINGQDMEIYSSYRKNETMLSVNKLTEWEHPKNIESKDFVWPTSFYSIAADPVRDLVFWTDTKFSMISVFNSSSLDRIDFNITDCYYPIALVIDPISTKLFWIDIGNSLVGPRIIMANMDGSDRKVLVKSGLRKPISLVLDMENQNLYWNDLNPGAIRYLDLKAFNTGETKIRTLFETNNYFPVSIALYKNRIYWSDLHQNRIYSIHKISGNGLSTIVEQVQSMVIRIVSPMDNMSLKRNINGDPKSSCCTDEHNPCKYSCLPTGSKGLATCFGTEHSRKTISSLWWFMVVPIVLISFLAIAFMKYRSVKSTNQLSLSSNSRNVLVYDHVKFWDDDKEENATNSNLVNVSDSVPILETV